MTSAEGRRLCWQNGEEGPRSTSDGKDGGDREKSPKAPTPPGNMKDPEQKTSTSTTINNQTYNTNSYGGSGTTGGQPDVGKGGTESPGQGTGTGSGSGTGDGEDDGDKGSASGGAGCDSPPVMTGDPVMMMVATQQWQTRCGESKADANGDGAPDYLGVNDAGDPAEGDLSVEGEGQLKQKDIGLDAIDTGGLIGGGGSCPLLGTLDFGRFGSVSLDDKPYWCQLVAILHGVLLLVGAFLALRILME